MVWSERTFCTTEYSGSARGKDQGSELELFASMFSKSGVPAAAVAGYENTLQNLLARTVQTAVPGYAPGTTMPTAQVIQEKFTPASYRGKGIGRKIQAALSVGSMSALDLPTVIYGMRNWSVHGSLIGSSFRTVPGFNLFIGTVLSATAETHAHLSAELLTRV